MGVNIFIVLMTLLIPAAMLGFGYYWNTHPPKQINCGYGYRTRRSMFSQKTWDFAHEVCSRVWRFAGWWTLIISSILTTLILVFISDIDTVGTFCFVISLLQIIPLLITLPITERALKRKFGI